MAIRQWTPQVQPLNRCLNKNTNMPNFDRIDRNIKAQCARKRNLCAHVSKAVRKAAILPNPNANK